MWRFLLVISLAGLFAVHAAARAGGGEGYSGSSSYSYSGSSSHGGGSSGGDFFSTFLYLYFQMVFRYPLIGLPLTLLFLYIGWRIRAGMNAGSIRPLTGGDTPEGGQISPRKLEELSRLSVRDPAFDERSFLARTGGAFLKIQKAWSAGDMSSALAFISDGVRERFERQLAGLKARGLRNLMEDVEVQDIELMACRSDKHFDALWVRVAAVATDRMVDAGGSTVSGSSGRQCFEEIWTFLRRPGARTLARPGLIEGSCPSCGAPLPIADAAQCGACKAWVNSGEYDWVLSEITQSCEWRMREPSRDVDGWAAASAGDPALNMAALEDRTSVIFWRWLEARRLGDPAPLRAVADEAYCLGFSASGAGSFEGAAVGAVDVVAFEEADSWTRAHISVKWSAAAEQRTHFFVLNRAVGAKTDVRQGLCTARCTSCGAPPAERSETVCGYCGAALNDGKKDWILTEVIPFGAWKRPPLAVSAPAGGLSWGAEMSPADAFGALALAMLVDGEESLAEKAFLEAYAKARGLPPAKAAQITTAARAGLLDAPKAGDGAQADSLLRGMIRMSLVDGVVTDAERAALHSFAARFRLRPDDVAAVIAEEREAKGRSLAA